MINRPRPDEHDSFYSTYIDKVPDGSVVDLMESELDSALALLGTVPSDRETHRYATGKWSLREVLGHIVDTERVFGYRAVAFARRDPSDLPSMDQDHWVASSNAGSRSLSSLTREFEQLRRSHVELFSSFDGEIFDRRGVASGCEITVRALAYIIVGHEMHHRMVLRTRYL